MLQRARRWLPPVVVCSLAAACGVSPKPEPPTTNPRPPTLASELVWRQGTDAGADADAITDTCTITGQPSAVEPFQGIVRVYNLENGDPPTSAPVDTLGGFTLSMHAARGDELRFEVLESTGGFGPRDLVVGDPNHPLSPAVRPLADCLYITSILWISGSESGAVGVDNLCDTDVQIAAPRPRSDADRVAVGEQYAWPLNLGPDVHLDLGVRILNGDTRDEHIVFLDATFPTADRRAVSVQVER
jgi:hypothetical protein